MHREQLRTVVASLQSVAPQYPGGIPTRYLSVDQPHVIFIYDHELAPEETLLLHAAIEKGMKLSSDSVLQYNVETVKPQFPTDAIIIALGKQAAQIVVGPRKATLTRGLWLPLEKSHMIVTHELSAVLADAALKREFWSDLQAVMERLAQ